MISTTAYVSTLAPSMTHPDVQALVEDSKTSNARQGITGMLVLRGDRVMQLLEGDHSRVSDLFRRISADPRHHDVVTVWRSTTQTRRFPNWTMGFDDLDDPSEPSTGGVWLEPTLPTLSPDDGGDTPAKNSQADYVRRRAATLRRALVSGDRLTTTLAIILNGHHPESVLDGPAPALRCAECRAVGGADANSYPCSTARNAIWALESALF